jgi:hypothetical protein
MRENGIFIPMCLYATSFYYQKRNIEYLFDNYISNYKHCLIVIADDLRAYNQIIKNLEENIDDALNSSRKKGDEIKNLVVNSLKDKEGSDILIKKWVDFKQNSEFIKIKEIVSNEIRINNSFKDVIHEFILFNLRKFDVQEDLESKYYEHQYILEEIAMSIFATEILGYSTELWEKAPTNSPDPIKFLYENSPDIVKKITGKSQLNRILTTLEK